MKKPNVLLTRCETDANGNIMGETVVEGECRLCGGNRIELRHPDPMTTEVFCCGCNKVTWTWKLSKGDVEVYRNGKKVEWGIN